MPSPLGLFSGKGGEGGSRGPGGGEPGARRPPPPPPGPAAAPGDAGAAELPDGTGTQWNWPSSVEPFSAVVELSGSTVVAMASK